MPRRLRRYRSRSLRQCLPCESLVISQTQSRDFEELWHGWIRWMHESLYV